MAREGHKALTCQGANVPVGSGSQGPEVQSLGPGHTPLLSLPHLQTRAPDRRHRDLPEWPSEQPKALGRAVTPPNMR